MKQLTTLSPPQSATSPRSKAIFSRAAIANLTSKSFFTAPLSTSKNASYWRSVVKQSQLSNSGQSEMDRLYRKNGASARNPIAGAYHEAEEAKKKGAENNDLETLMKTMTMSHSSQTRAAGLLVDKDADRFERKLTADLQNVKGIDLDGDGHIDDDELEFAKEMEARLIRSKAFIRKVEKYNCPWNWFGSKWSNINNDQRCDILFKNPHFDVLLDQMITKLRNYTTSQSPRMHVTLSPRRSLKLQTRHERHKQHEKEMYDAILKDRNVRIQTAHSDPLSTQPQSYREYLTSVNPVTGKYVFE
jgi:hypothetical protein